MRNFLRCGSFFLIKFDIFIIVEVESSFIILEVRYCKEQ
jgi:hypothetical protein